MLRELTRLVGGGGRAALQDMKAARLAILNRHLDRQLVVLDVGCRWGFSDVWKQLTSHVRLYGFDPDEKECARLAAQYPDENIVLVPKALADSAGDRALYLTREPGCSSLYPPISQLSSTIPELACATEIDRTMVRVTTLDSWAAAAEVEQVDFVKLDVQGAELQVLKGGARCLQKARGLELEVEFNPIYEGQPLFGDIDAYLRDQGWVLWRLSNLVHYTDGPGRYLAPASDTYYYDSRPTKVSPLAGQLYWGHAHYVRPATAAGGQDLDWRQCVRDAAIFEVLGFTDLVHRLLVSAASTGPTELAQALASSGLLPKSDTEPGEKRR